MLLVGIAGGTGSGKTTLVRQIVQQLPPGQVVVIPQDAYYKDNSHIPFEKRKIVSSDHTQDGFHQEVRLFGMEPVSGIRDNLGLGIREYLPDQRLVSICYVF